MICSLGYLGCNRLYYKRSYTATGRLIELCCTLQLDRDTACHVQYRQRQATPGKL
jgi:hypothetical protein